ncbi:hypothetical protein MLD38_007111 [Melastoma candidum]|uniref:Uncharacterized protein n=1 Tax=Melastoma candidum TaxID=119954 RepID=A0ACB9RT32_9MYRT|nr:hypothetical protein MLD38_007111 [Melastoma candidum]
MGLLPLDSERDRGVREGFWSGSDEVHCGCYGGALRTSCCRWGAPGSWGAVEAAVAESASRGGVEGLCGSRKALVIRKILQEAWWPQEVVLLRRSIFRDGERGTFCEQLRGMRLAGRSAERALSGRSRRPLRLEDLLKRSEAFGGDGSWKPVDPKRGGTVQEEGETVSLGACPLPPLFWKAGGCRKLSSAPVVSQVATSHQGDDDTSVDKRLKKRGNWDLLTLKGGDHVYSRSINTFFPCTETSGVEDVIDEDGKVEVNEMVAVIEACSEEALTLELFEEVAAYTGWIRENASAAAEYFGMTALESILLPV